MNFDDYDLPSMLLRDLIALRHSKAELMASLVGSLYPPVVAAELREIEDELSRRRKLLRDAYKPRKRADS